jgi:AcrR family transcriptional regulator
MIDTKEKILDTAERLFGENGYGATSLRQIIAEAGVNLAAVHYHFGTKEELLDAAVVRKLAPINADRMRLLDEAGARAGGKPIAIEAFLDAFLRPAVMQARLDPSFCRFMGRLHAENLMSRVIANNFQEVSARFLGGLRQVLADLPQDELIWRVHFMVGAMAHTLKSSPEYPGVMVGEAVDTETLLHRIVNFLSAGFRAPATPPVAPGPEGAVLPPASVEVNS